MTQYIGQITVILESDKPSQASETLRLLGKQIQDTSDEVVFADHNGDIESYEEFERECEESLTSQPQLPLVTVLLESLERCAALLADYDEDLGEEGEAYRDAIAAIAKAHATSENPGVIQRQLTSSAMFHTPGLFPALLVACRMVVDRWERGDLAEAARACQRAVAQAETACLTSEFSPSAPECHSRFEIEHDPLENANRAYVLVDGKFDVAILRTGEGIVIDVYPKEWIDPIDTMTVWDEDVDDATAESEVDHAAKEL